jgi:DNA modification methylase
MKQAPNNQGKKGYGTAIAQGVIESSDGMAYPSNVLSLGKNREALGHPAAYPTALPDFFTRVMTDRGDIVFDPFLGSGSTLIAAHALERRCFGTEISATYCDTIIERWQLFTDSEAKLIDERG